MFTRAYPLIHRNRKRTAKRPRTVAPAALSLVSAVYEEAAWGQLSFDRAIDAAGLVGSEIIIDDAGSGLRYVGLDAAVIIDPQTIRVELVEDGSSGTANTLLTASAGTGIVAIDDGAVWAGVTDVELPFP